MMELLNCPECNKEVNSTCAVCPCCGFDLKMYKEMYRSILEKKIRDGEKNDTKTTEASGQLNINHTVNYNVPRCPTCGSTSLEKITAVDKAVNIALFGIFGNKRRYQWHCKNCGYNW